MRKRFFPGQAAQHWDRLSREALEAVFEDFQNVVGNGPEQPSLALKLVQLLPEVWTRWPPAVPSNLHISVAFILFLCPVLINLSDRIATMLSVILVCVLSELVLLHFFILLSHLIDVSEDS